MIKLWGLRQGLVHHGYEPSKVAELTPITVVSYQFFTGDAHPTMSPAVPPVTGTIVFFGAPNPSLFTVFLGRLRTTKVPARQHTAPGFGLDSPAKQFLVRPWYRYIVSRPASRPGAWGMDMGLFCMGDQVPIGPPTVLLLDTPKVAVPRS